MTNTIRRRLADLEAATAGLNAAELGVLNSVTPGTVAASKAIVVDSNKDASALRNLGVVNLDAGASGTAGSVDIFPTTASKGKVSLTATANTNDDAITITNAAFGQASTITLPDPGAAAASYVLTEGAQTVNGVKTFGSIQQLKATNAITAFATGGQASATALASTINSITTCATAGDSVKLPAAVAGKMIQVSNLGAAYANVFPQTGELIDALSANAAVSLPVGASLIFTCAVAGSWKSTGVVKLDAKYTTGTTTTTFAAGQLTGAAQVVYNNTQGTPGSIATRTAAEMFADDPFARVGGSYRLRIINNQGTGTLTVTAGSNVTLTGTMTIAANTFRDFVVTYTSASALVIQTAGVGTDT